MNTGPAAILYLVVVLPLLVVLGVFYYRRTVPPVSVASRRLLRALRILALAALAVALARPVFDWERESERTPTWMRLVDYSASMDRSDPATGRSRLAQAESWLADPAWPRLEDVELATAYFADTLASDSTGLGRQGTDLHQALLRLSQAPDAPSVVFMLSDGADNGTTDPATGDWAFPVYTICVGDSGELADLAVLAIEAPASVMSGDSVDVRARISATGKAGQSVLTFRAGDHQELRTVQLSGGGRQQDVVFSFRPDSAGVYPVAVELAAGGDEVTVANNRIGTRVFVEPRRRRGVLLANAPDWENAFLTRRLNTIDRLDLEVRYRTLAGRGGFRAWPQGFDSLAAYDLVILMDMPPLVWSSLTPDLGRFLREGAGSILFLLGPRAAVADWPDVQRALLGVRWTARPPGVLVVNGPVRLSGAGRFHPVSSFASGAGTERIWADLPQLSGVIPSLPDDGTVPLVTMATAGFSWPVLTAAHRGRGRVLTVLGHPLWRWDFAAAATGETEWTQPFWSAAVRWLTSTQQGERLVVEVSADPLPALAPPELTAVLVDESWQPDSRASVVAEVRDSTGQLVQTFELRTVAPGRYQGEGRPLPPGTYSYHVRAHRDTALVAEYVGSVVAGDVSREDLTPASRPELLERLSVATGGRRLSVDDWAQILDSIPVEAEPQVTYGTLRLWDSPWLLGLVLMLLAVEWILRRRFQML